MHTKLSGERVVLVAKGNRAMVDNDEATDGSAQTPEGGGSGAGSGAECSPLQSRAAFLENWDWQSVVGINQRGQAQHGINSETGRAGAEQWEETHRQEITLEQTFDFLRGCHRSAPFLFFHGNTFATIGRELAVVLFSDLPTVRRREVGSAIAHFIGGVLDKESMISMVESLSESAELQPGDRVRTLKGSLHGQVTEVLEDGRIVWIASTGTKFIGLPESLVKEDETS